MMTTAEKAKEAVLERVVVLAKDATVLDLAHLTDAIIKTTGEDHKHLDRCFDILTSGLGALTPKKEQTKGGKK